MDNIILIGMPGSGKSTLGVLLAKLLGYDFLDSDLLIQNAAGKRLFEIIDEMGSEGILAQEDVINSVISAERTVIATGGSVVYCENAMKHLGSLGKVVYLKIPFAEVEKRIGNFSTRGVVIRNGGTLADMYNERLPLYEKYADITVDCTEAELTANANKILAAISQNN